MKDNNQHTIKKSYTSPLIEEVMIDREISIAMKSPPVNPTDPTDPTNPGDIEGVGGYYKKELPTYERANFPNSASPFKSSPDY